LNTTTEIGLTPFASSGAVNHVYHQLLSAILSRKLGAQDRLPSEAQLSDQLGVSRPTLREALRMLGQAGIVEQRRGRYGGWFLARRESVSISDSIAVLLILERISLREIFEARSLLEATAAELAAKAPSERHIEAMLKAIEESEASPISAKVFAHTNGLFHLALVNASHNGVLTIMMNSIRPLVDYSLGKIQLDEASIARANSAHRKILNAIISGNQELSRLAVIDHLGSFRKRIEETSGDISKIEIPTELSKISIY
jgi:GntR family transcriptional regulator, L-lactate dehydrogenase operon regulator